MSEVEKTRVAAVMRDMERHCLGHECVEDSPVARWARELLGALKSDASDCSEAQNPSCADAAETADATSEAQKVTRDPAEDVSMSAYDLLPADERDAIAWVRDHGGLDYVRAEWRSRVPYDRYERRRQRLLGHIAECETALGRRREIISKLTHRVRDLTNENAELRKRAMPEGVKWPRYDTSEFVLIGDDVIGPDYGESIHVDEITFHSNGFTVREKTGLDHWYESDDKFERPAILAADGEPLEVGQTVWSVNDGRKYKVVTVESPVQFDTTSIKVDDGKAACGVWIRPDNLTHQRPVLDADGVPIELGDDLYSVESSLKIHVSNIDRVNCRIATSAMFALDKWADPSMFTHTKPEPPDSWDALWDDIEDCAVGYESFMCRCRALAERERGE